MSRNPITRRRVLASLGAAGVVSLGGLTVLTEPSLAYQNSEQIESDGNDLLFEWVETYNGETIEGPGNRTGSPPEMRISFENVLPGDAGALGIKMTLDSPTDPDPSVDPYFAVDLHESSENGLTEAEQEAGDSSGGQGELQEYIDVKIWYDTGLDPIRTLGVSNNQQDFGEGLIDSDAEGTLGEVATNLPDSLPDGLETNSVDPNDGLRLDPTDTNCLTPDNEVIIAFGWEFADQPGINVTQGDAVTFDLIFGAADGCE
jgi:hypothetical protein